MSDLESTRGVPEPRPSVDLTAWPCGSHGTMRFDVPRPPLGTLKKRLRAFLHAVPHVEAATLLAVSDSAWGGEGPVPTVLLDTPQDVEPLFRAWRDARLGAGPVAFCQSGEDVLTTFAEHYAIPFYARATSALPAPLSSAELAETIAGLPDVPQLAALTRYLDSLEERYDDLPPEEAEREYRAQAEEKARVLADARARATHGAAKEFLLRQLRDGVPFSLLLRTFGREVTFGQSALTDGEQAVWVGDRPVERHVARVTPLPLVGIANPMDPFGTTDCLLLEAGDDWLRVVVSLVARAAAIFVVCDEVSDGVGKELLAIQAMEREDDAVIIIPTERAMEAARRLQLLAPGAPLPAPELLQRRLATFGVTATSDEFLALPAAGA